MKGKKVCNMKYDGNNYVNIYKFQKHHFKKILNLMLNLSSTFQIVEEYGELSVENLNIHQDFISITRSNKWPGTIKGPKAYVYSFKMTKNITDFLGKYDGFLSCEEGCFVSKALEDQSDYSFFEKETGGCLLFTISHEGDVFLREEIYNKYFLK